MIMKDDRSFEEKTTYPILIGGIDRFLSEWCPHGISYAFWACKEEDEPTVMKWVKSRGDINPVESHYKEVNKQGKGHCHIYVVEDGHPALK
jgi:hypothetical protein